MFICQDSRHRCGGSASGVTRGHEIFELPMGQDRGYGKAVKVGLSVAGHAVAGGLGGVESTGHVVVKLRGVDLPDMR